MSNAVVLRLDQISKSFVMAGKEINVLRNITLELTSGEALALVGPSGAGKSTLLHIAGLLLKPTEGRLEIDGEDCARHPELTLARLRSNKIGFVFQMHHLLPDFNALENVCIPALLAGSNRREAMLRAKDLLEQVGLQERLNHRPGELSGGEQQRVALARALVNRPSVLLADEPTGNLDTVTAKEIHNIIWNFHREQGQTIVLVTHNMELAQGATRMVPMKDGRLVEPNTVR
jgi:lipoprotein-releasing system ATP-binding protein